MTAGDLFGISIDGDDVEAALLAFLKEWMPTYLPAIVREKDPDKKLWPGGVGNPEENGGIAAVLPVEEFTVKHASAENWPEERLPMLLAHCPGFAAPPVRHGDGKIDVTFLVNLSAIASGGDIGDTKKLARVYASAANLAIVQNPDLGGLVNATDWVNMSNFPITRGIEAERSLMAVANSYVIEVAGILDATAGPDAPLEEPDESPGPRPKVKKDGGSADIRPGAAAVKRLRDGGSFLPE